MTNTVLLGGARSGKSALAVRRARSYAAPVFFLATAGAGDDEMAERIARHRAERPPAWVTIEEPLELGEAIAATPDRACLIIDCLSLWIANLIERGDDDEAIVGLASEAAGLAAARPGPTVTVSNEVGLGVVPPSELGRRYRDLLGRTNAIWAERADEVVLIVAGHGVVLEATDEL